MVGRDKKLLVLLLTHLCCENALDLGRGFDSCQPGPPFFALSVRSGRKRVCREHLNSKPPLAPQTHVHSSGVVHGSDTREQRKTRLQQ